MRIVFTYVVADDQYYMKKNYGTHIRNLWKNTMFVWLRANRGELKDSGKLEFNILEK